MSGSGIIYTDDGPVYMLDVSDWVVLRDGDGNMLVAPKRLPPNPPDYTGGE